MLNKVIISSGLSPCSSLRSSKWCGVVSFRYLVGNVHVLLVRAGVDAVPLVDVDPRDVLPGIFLEVIRNSVVLVQRVRLDRFLMLLLDLPVLW